VIAIYFQRIQSIDTVHRTDEVGSLLGEGRYGTVVRALDRSRSKEVAIKIMSGIAHINSYAEELDAMQRIKAADPDDKLCVSS
jgi:serine/threonine protein kinase